MYASIIILYALLLNSVFFHENIFDGMENFMSEKCRFYSECDMLKKYYLSRDANLYVHQFLKLFLRELKLRRALQSLHPMC